MEFFISHNIDYIDPYPDENQDHYLAECIKSWGCSASVSLFDAGSQVFKVEGIQGVIGYRLRSNSAAVLGDPICREEDKVQLARAFHAMCKEKGWTYVYLTVSESFTKALLREEGGAAIEIGEELILDPKEDITSGSKGRVVRGKINHALREGLVVEEYLGTSEHIEHELEEVGASWLHARKGPQIFIAKVDLFAERIGRRWFYARQGTKIVGVMLLHEMDQREGFLLQLLMAIPGAPIGTSEFLVASVLEALAKEGCPFFSFGVAQLAELGEVIGFGSVTTFCMRKIFKLFQKLFHLANKRKFWQKFQPKSEKAYLLFSKKRIGIKELRTLMRSLNISFF